jgi:hypothetical protein
MGYNHKSDDNEYRQITECLLPVMAYIKQVIRESVRDAVSDLVKPANAGLDPEETLTRDEAAKEFKVSKSSIDNYRKLGFITPCGIRGSVRYKRGDLQKAFSHKITDDTPRGRKRK